MESCPTQAVLPLVGLAAEKVIRDRYTSGANNVKTTNGTTAKGETNGARQKSRSTMNSRQATSRQAVSWS
ncbi:MAG: hypothetical protein ACQESR_18475 [Planctomycetota bacterium]